MIEALVTPVAGAKGRIITPEPGVGSTHRVAWVSVYHPHPPSSPKDRASCGVNVIVSLLRVHSACAILNVTLHKIGHHFWAECSLRVWRIGQT